MSYSLGDVFHLMARFWVLPVACRILMIEMILTLIRSKTIIPYLNKAPLPYMAPLPCCCRIMTVEPHTATDNLNYHPSVLQEDLAVPGQKRVVTLPFPSLQPGVGGCRLRRPNIDFISLCKNRIVIWRGRQGTGSYFALP